LKAAAILQIYSKYLKKEPKSLLYLQLKAAVEAATKEDAAGFNCCFQV
jgi:hypothetical protein